MQRTVNLVIGLAVVVGVSLILFGSIGGSKKSDHSRSSPPRTPGALPELPQLDMANQMVGPSSSPPPPIPSMAQFTPPRRNERLEARLANTVALTDERWERARRRIRRVFGGALSSETEAAIQAAISTWVDMQANSVSAYQGGYIDRHMLGIHSGWNRNVYMLAIQDALGNADFQRYAAGPDELDEIDPDL
jgi:hypothetical protein